MRRRAIVTATLIGGGVVAAVGAMLLWATLTRTAPIQTPREGYWLSHGSTIKSTVPARYRRIIAAAGRQGVRSEPQAGITVDYPLPQSIFPPDIVAPTFLWHDSTPRVTHWLIDIALRDSSHIYIVTSGPGPEPPRIDDRCTGPNNRIHVGTQYEQSARTWSPSPAVWNALVKQPADLPVTFTFYGLRQGRFSGFLSKGRFSLVIAADPVGAPLFYRDVPLKPSKNDKGIIQPLAPNALPLIAWRLRDLAKPDSRVVLQDMPTCANCHSFSADGATLAMDIDGPSGDKGAYAIAPIKRDMVISAADIISWNDFPRKLPNHKTIGFLSRISPDGRSVITTVNESVYVVNFTDFRFLQVFYPTRGILACYDRQTGRMIPLSGADNLDFVHCDPVWTPDGASIIFARAPADTIKAPNRPLAKQANDENELQIQYDLYRIPFNGGAGGIAQPIEGASRNAMSNTFPKVSPDGRWIVFVKCRNAQLMRPDSRLWIVSTRGGEAREMRCNTSLMNSWHSFSPNGRWMVFSSKANSPYTQLFLTHLDTNGNDSPPILVPNSTADNRAANLPEFVNICPDSLISIKAPTVEYYRYFEKGTEFMDAGHYTQAVEQFQLALQAEPTSSRINNNLGVCLVNCGRVEEALPCFFKAIATDPRNWAGYNNLGSASNKLGKVDEAIGYFRKAIAIEPAYKLANYNLSVAFATKGDIPAAKAQLRKTIALGDPVAPMYHDLGRLLAGQDSVAAALHCFDQAIAVDPTFTEAHFDRGRLLAREGRNQEALQAFQKAIQLKPDYAQAYNRAGLLLAQAGNMQAAATQFNKAIAIDPTYEEARRNLNRALSLR
jgi:tetratricopeptide (TPR) repeat protein